MPARRIQVTGLVQGVFFRAHTKEKAEELGITGWVQNCEDGSVEIHAEGSDNALKELEKWCYEGPPAAQVENVQSEEIPEEGLAEFEIQH